MASDRGPDMLTNVGCFGEAIGVDLFRSCLSVLSKSLKDGWESSALPCPNVEPLRLSSSPNPLGSPLNMLENLLCVENQLYRYYVKDVHSLPRNFSQSYLAAFDDRSQKVSYSVNR